MGPVLFLGSLTAASCPTSPDGIPTFMVATVDQVSWTADGNTYARYWPPSADYHAGDSTLVVFGVGHAGGSQCAVALRARPVIRDTTSFVLGDTGTAGSAMFTDEPFNARDTIYWTATAAPGYLIVTGFDTVAHVVTGKFGFSATSADSRRTVHVTDGSFQLHYLLYPGRTP